MGGEINVSKTGGSISILNRRSIRQTRRLVRLELVRTDLPNYTYVVAKGEKPPYRILMGEDGLRR